MPLVIQRQGKADRPVILCDYCRQPIEQAEDGNYQWVMARDGQVTDGGPAFFTHKRCCQAFEVGQGAGFFWGVMDLDCLPIFLAQNLGVDQQAATEKARQFMQE